MGKSRCAALVIFTFVSMVSGAQVTDEDSSKIVQKDNIAQKSETRDPAKIGLNYVLSTQQEIAKNLMEQMQEHGPVAAIAFCSEKALPITRQMAQKHSATIRRVSDKHRNPANKPNAEELSIIKRYKEWNGQKKELKPITQVSEGMVQFYSPIVTNSMCLKCHGAPSSFSPDLKNTLEKLYPTDLATGYKENEIRGIWSLQFKVR